MTLEEFMQQKALERGLEKTPLRYFYETFDSGAEEIDPNRVDFQQLLPILKRMEPAYAQRVLDEGDGYSNSVLMNIEQQLKNEYYSDPSNFVSTRATPIATGINTFNEGNEDQKRIIDQINTGQLRVVPVSYEVDVSDGGKELVTGYDLKDAKTGQTVQKQIQAIDAEKGIFNIVADDRNSSGFFNNYVSTDPSGFVNPITSPEQSQYASKPNSSLNFIKDSIKGLLSMAAIAATAGGAGAALGSALGTGTTAGNLALNAGVNLLKQGVTGQFDPLGLATSTALTYGLGGADGTDVLTADDLYTGQAMTDLATSYDDATRLADLVKSFESPTELTGPTIDVASRTDIPINLQDGLTASEIDQPYDVSPLTDPVTGQPFGSIEQPLVDNLVPSGNEFAGMTSQDLARLDSTGVYTPAGNEFAGMTSEDLARLDSTGIYTPAGNEFAGMTSEDLAKLDSTGTSSFGITPRQLLTGANIARSLLSSGQEQAAAPATQFKGTRRPQGQVDYSGILNLLQMQSPQRRSLLG